MKGRPSWNQLLILVYAGVMTVDELGNRSSDEKRNRTKIWFKSTYKCKTLVEIISRVEKLKDKLHLLLARIEFRKTDEKRSHVRHMPSGMIFREKESKKSPNMANINSIRQYWKKIVSVKKTFEHKNQLLVA
jgi:hypothetical protein